MQLRKLHRIGLKFTYPSEYQVQLYCTLMLTYLDKNSNKFYGLELHEVTYKGRKLYSVYSHYGRLEDLSLRARSTHHVCIFFDKYQDALAKYNTLKKSKTGKGYNEVHLASSLIGSEKLREMLDSAEAEEVDGETEDQNEGEPTDPLQHDVEGLIHLIYGSASATLQKRISAKITAKGIETPIGVLKLEQIKAGEKILLELKELFDKNRKQYNKVKTKVINLSGQYYSLIPHKFEGSRKKGLTGLTIFNDEVFQEEFELLQLMKDVYSVGTKSFEGDSLVYNQYRALKSTIRSIGGREVDRILHFLNLEPNVEVEEIYAVSRKKEEQTAEVLESDSNLRYLIHGSRKANWLGLLSRGMMLPQSVVSTFDVKRTDVGMLGYGIYFGDSFYTGVKYCKESYGDSGLVGIYAVALGRAKVYKKHMLGITAPPSGYDSVRGQMSTSGDFNENEHVIYDESKQSLRYLIKFKETKSQSQYPLPTWVQTLFSMEGELSEIHESALESTIQGDVQQEGPEDGHFGLSSFNFTINEEEEESPIFLEQEVTQSFGEPELGITPIPETGAILGFEAPVEDMGQFGIDPSLYAQSQYGGTIGGEDQFGIPQSGPDMDDYSFNIGKPPDEEGDENVFGLSARDAEPSFTFSEASTRQENEFDIQVPSASSDGYEAVDIGTRTDYLKYYTREQLQTKKEEDDIRRLYALYRSDYQLQDPHLLLVNPYENEKVFRSFVFSREIAAEKRQPKLFEATRTPYVEGGSSIVEQKEFQRRWKKYTGGILDSLDWSNIFVAGGSVVKCLMTGTTESELEEAGDIDMFVYGLETEEEATWKMQSIYGTIKSILPKGDVGLARMKNSITVLLRQPIRHVQIILRMYMSPSEILTGFDLDSCTGGFDGENAWVHQRLRRALTHRFNLIDLSRRSLNFESRLIKYAKRGFCVNVPHLKMERINEEIYSLPRPFLKGLAKLIVADPQTKPATFKNEKLRGMRYWEIRDLIRKKNLVPSKDNGDDYTNLRIPYGRHWQAFRIVSYLNFMDKRYFFSQKRKKEAKSGHSHAVVTGMEGVLNGWSSWCTICGSNKKKGILEDKGVFSPDSVYGKLRWLSENPGRQLLTGSFHPLTDDDWEKQAYHGWMRDSISESGSEASSDLASESSSESSSEEELDQPFGSSYAHPQETGYNYPEVKSKLELQLYSGDSSVCNLVRSFESNKQREKLIKKLDEMGSRKLKKTLTFPFFSMHFSHFLYI